MKLINANPIIEKYKNYEYFSGYEDFDEGVEAGVLFVVDELENASEIDPVHVVCGCYCKECIYKEKSTVKNPKYYWCQLRDSYMDLDGFCSEGRKDENQ